MAKLILEQAAFLLHYCKLVEYITSEGYIVTGGELQRPIEMQKIYVDTNRSKTMNSRHIDKLAGDLNIFDKNGKYITDPAILNKFGQYWESLSPQNRWGGNFDKDWDRKDNFIDRPHYERGLPR